jgi:hypothetical protein
MLRVTITAAIRDQAKRLAEPLMRLYRNNDDSIRRGEGIYYAKIGELIVADLFGWDHVDTVDTDLEKVLISGKKRRVEVKVKDRGVPPRGWFNGTVAAANIEQDCDDYLFCSSVHDSVLYIVGVVPKSVFFKHAIFYKKDDPDPERTDWPFKADSYNMHYNSDYMLEVGCEDTSQWSQKSSRGLVGDFVSLGGRDTVANTQNVKPQKMGLPGLLPMDRMMKLYGNR